MIDVLSFQRSRWAGMSEEIALTPTPLTTTNPTVLPFAPIQGERQFFGQVEAIRGFGALAVAVHHFSFQQLYGLPLLPDITNVPPLNQVLKRSDIHLVPGHASVMLFFIISGFVLRLALAHGPQAWPVASVRFTVKRIFRLLPVVLMGTIFTAWYFGGVVTVYQQGSHDLTVREFIANALLLDTSMNTTLWSLQVEMAAVPFMLGLYYAERRWGPKPVLLAGFIATGLIFVKSWALIPSVSHHLFAIILGMTIPTYGRQMVEALRLRTAISAVVIALFFFVMTGPFLGVYSHWTRIGEGYSAYVLVAVVAYRTDWRVVRFLDGALFRLLGRISGSYYVLHMLLGTIFFLHLYPYAMPAHWFTAAPWLVGPMMMAEYLLLLGCCSWLGYTFVEAPGIRLGAWLLRRGQGTKSGSPTTHTENSPPPANRATA